jgi:2-methylisocitrate lyase-like PEP mutase family enzyme
MEDNALPRSKASRGRRCRGKSRKIRAKATQKKSDFMVIARTEALIAGWVMGA